MAKTKISEYDATAANNTDIDSINIAEGMAPSNVNNALRMQMSHLKTEFYKTGTGNTSLGDGALDSLDGSSPGGSNVAIGKDAGTAISTGDRNTAVGFEAGKTHSTNVASTYIGYRAGYLATGESATFVGDNSGQNTTGNENTFLGQQAGYLVTSGAKNTIIGRFDGNQGGLDIRTSSNNIVLSDGDGNPRLICNSAGEIGMNGNPAGTVSLNVIADASNHAVRMESPTASYHPLLIDNLGSSGTRNFVSFRISNSTKGTISSDGSTTSYNTSSDYRLKENVSYSWDATTRLKQLKPARFNWIGNSEAGTQDGFLAHEAQTVVPEAITGTKDEVEVWADGDELPDGVSVGDNKLDDDGKTIPVMQGIDQSKLVPLLTAALQEAITKIETLETKVAALEAE